MPGVGVGVGVGISGFDVDSGFNFGLVDCGAGDMSLETRQDGSWADRHHGRPVSPGEAYFFSRLEAALREAYAAGKTVDDMLDDVREVFEDEHHQTFLNASNSTDLGVNQNPTNLHNPGFLSLSSASPLLVSSLTSTEVSGAPGMQNSAKLPHHEIHSPASHTSSMVGSGALERYTPQNPRPWFNVDFWGLSSFQAYLSYENERGRHSRPFALHDTEVVQDENQLVEAGAHPREYISYGFAASLSGRPWLEKEARSLWADAVEAPVEVNRRFSEFYRLREVLAKVYQYRVGQSSRVHLILVPPLPPKRSFALISSQDRAFVLQRMRELEVWLRYISLHSIIGMSMPVKTFMLDSVHDGRDEMDEMDDDDDIDTVDSHSVVNSNTNGQGSMSLLRPKHKRDRLSGAAAFAEDPIVATRARLQVDMVLRRFGSGPVALGAINGVLPGLQRGYHTGKISLRHLEERTQARVDEESALGLALLRLSKVEQHNAKYAPMRLDPLNYLGVALKRRRADEAQAAVSLLEASHNLEETLRLFSKHVFPRMSHLVGFLYNSSVAARQEDEHQHGVTPPERLAAEWFCVNHVRAALLASAAERYAQDQIMLAARRRARWERLKANLLNLDAQALYNALERDVLTHNEDGMDPEQPSFAEFVRDRDRDSVYSEQSMLVFEQREEQIRQMQAAQERRSSPPPVPSRSAPPLPRRKKRVTFADDSTPAAPGGAARTESEWARSETDDGVPFWVNKHTGQTRYRPPATSPEERQAQQDVEAVVQKWSQNNHNLPAMLINLRDIASPLERFTDFSVAQKQALHSSTSLQRKLVRQVLRQTHPDKQPPNQPTYNAFLAARLFHIFASLS